MSTVVEVDLEVVDAMSRRVQELQASVFKLHAHTRAVQRFRFHRSAD